MLCILTVFVLNSLLRLHESLVFQFFLCTVVLTPIVGSQIQVLLDNLRGKKESEPWSGVEIPSSVGALSFVQTEPPFLLGTVRSIKVAGALQPRRGGCMDSRLFLKMSSDFGLIMHNLMSFVFFKQPTPGLLVYDEYTFMFTIAFLLSLVDLVNR